MIITFVGHSDVYINEELYLKVKVAINDIAEKNLQITFYNGAYGDFDH